MTLRQTLYVGDDCLHHCGLGFGQSGSHHDTRVLRVYAVSVFRTSPVFPTGCGPIRLSPSGKLGDPEVCSSVPPSSVRRIRLSVMWRTLQAVELSLCHAGLAEPRYKRLLPFSALSACSCSLALSGPGKPLPLGSPLNPTHLRWGCCMHYCGAPDAGGSRLQAVVGQGAFPRCAAQANLLCALPSLAMK